MSSEKQNTARQRQALKEACFNVFYEEKLSGKNTERRELQRMLSDLKEDDVVHVHEVSRLSRSVKDLLTIVESIKDQGASLRSSNESWLDTSNDNPMNEFLFNIFGSLA